MLHFDAETEIRQSRSKGAWRERRGDGRPVAGRSRRGARLRKSPREGRHTVIPAARVSARGGSGAARGGEHSGGGFRADAEPVGAFVIRDGEVEWKPVFDLGATVRRGQLVGVVALLVLWAVVRALRGR